MTRNKPPKKRIRVTPALIVGLLMALAAIFLGLIGAVFYDEINGYFATGVGVCFFILVLYAGRR